MKITPILAAGVVALPMLFATQVFAQSKPADCDLTLRHVSDAQPKVADPTARADVKKLWEEAQVAQKANDTNLCMQKLEQAMARGNIPRR